MGYCASVIRMSLQVSLLKPLLLHIKVRLPVLLCAVKTVEGDFRFCWTTTPNVGQTHKENPNLVRILYMVCTLNDIYKQYDKLHEHWYTKISSLRCVADRNPPQNASDLYTRYWSDAEHCRPCTRLSGVNWWKQKQITLIVPIGYSLFADHRSVPSSGPGLVCLTILCLSRVRVHRFRDNAVTGDIPLISPVLESMVPLSTWYRMSGTSGIYYFWQPDRLCYSPPLLGFYWNRWGGNSFASGLNASKEWITRDQFSGLGITSAFAPLSLAFNVSPCVFILPFPPDVFNFGIFIA